MIPFVPLVKRGLCMCLSLQISEYSQTPPRPQTKAPVCVFVEENKWLLCACAQCPSVLACNARTLALRSERFAGVARRAQRLFEIIRQLPALPGFPEFTLLFFLIVFCSPLSGLEGFLEQQLLTAGSDSYSDISRTAVLSTRPASEKRGL